MLFSSSWAWLQVLNYSCYIISVFYIFLLGIPTGKLPWLRVSLYLRCAQKMFPCSFKEKLHLKILMHFPFQIRKHGLYRLVVVRYYLFFSCIGYCSCRLLLSALLLPVYLQSEKNLLRCQVLHQHFCNNWPHFKENTETLMYSRNIELIATTKILTCDCLTSYGIG